jgi:hypothetical protein
LNDLVIWHPDPEALFGFFGAVGNGTADDTIAVQRTFTQAILAGVPVGGVGNFNITSTITVSNCFGLLLRGAGVPIGGSIGTTFRWSGDSTSPLFALDDCYQMHWSDFVIKAAAPLAIGVRQRNINAGGINAPTHNYFENIVLDGVSNQLGKGWVTTATGGLDANNDIHLWINCSVINYGSGGATDAAGWSFEHSQSLQMQLINCKAVAGSGGKYGVTTVLGGGTAPNFQWIGGAMSGNSVADFYVGALSFPVSVDGLVSEHSAALLVQSGSFAGPFPVSLRNIRWNSENSLAADNHIVYYAAGGPLTIEQCAFESLSTTSAGDIYFTPPSINARLKVHSTTITTTAATPINYPVASRYDILNNTLYTLATTTYSPIANAKPPVTRRWTIMPTAMASGSGAPALATDGTAGAGTATRVWPLTHGTQNGVFAEAPLPADYAGGAMTIKVKWAGATAGNGTTDAVYWQVRATSVSDTDATDKAVESNNNAQPLVSATAKAITTTQISADLTAIAGDLLRIEVVRRGDQGTDTFTGIAWLLGIAIEYSASLAV